MTPPDDTTPVDCSLEAVMLREGEAVDRADLAAQHFDTITGR